MPNGNAATLFALSTADLVGRNDPGSLPNIAGGINLGCEGNYNGETKDGWGALLPVGNQANVVRMSSSGRAQRDYGISFDATRSSYLYGNRYFDGARVVPASLFIPGFIVKY